MAEVEVTLEAGSTVAPAPAATTTAAAATTTATATTPTPTTTTTTTTTTTATTTASEAALSVLPMPEQEPRDANGNVVVTVVDGLLPTSAVEPPVSAAPPAKGKRKQKTTADDTDEDDTGTTARVPRAGVRSSSRKRQASAAGLQADAAAEDGAGVGEDDGEWSERGPVAGRVTKRGRTSRAPRDVPGMVTYNVTDEMRAASSSSRRGAGKKGKATPKKKKKATPKGKADNVCKFCGCAVGQAEARMLRWAGTGRKCAMCLCGPGRELEGLYFCTKCKRLHHDGTSRITDAMRDCKKVLWDKGSKCVGPASTMYNAPSPGNSARARSFAVRHARLREIDSGKAGAPAPAGASSPAPPSAATGAAAGAVAAGGAAPQQQQQQQPPPPVQVQVVDGAASEPWPVVVQNAQPMVPVVPVTRVEGVDDAGAAVVGQEQGKGGKSA